MDQSWITCSPGLELFIQHNDPMPSDLGGQNTISIYGARVEGIPVMEKFLLLLDALLLLEHSFLLMEGGLMVAERDLQNALRGTPAEERRVHTDLYLRHGLHLPHTSVLRCLADRPQLMRCATDSFTTTAAAKWLLCQNEPMWPYLRNHHLVNPSVLSIVERWDAMSVRERRCVVRRLRQGGAN